MAIEKETNRCLNMFYIFLPHIWLDVDDGRALFGRKFLRYVSYSVSDRFIFVSQCHNLTGPLREDVMKSVREG